MTTDHPPKPRLTLRIGITGHRPNKLSAANAERVRGELTAVFADLSQAAAGILARPGNRAAYLDAPPVVRLVTGMAEGADQIAVAVWPAGDADRPIEAILPFPKDEYLKDFAKSAAGDGRDVSKDFLDALARASAVTELPMPRATERERGYVSAGLYLLRQIDVLVAVWDGLEPKPGGTGAVVRDARNSGIPVVWISATTPEPPALIERVVNGAPEVSPLSWPAGAIDAVLAPVFAAPAPGDTPHDRRESRDGLETFYDERWVSRCRMHAYDMLKRWACHQRPFYRTIELPSFSESRAEFEKLIAAAPSADLAERLKTILSPRYVWADTLAVYFSHCYRSAYVQSYFLSAVAVFIALAGVFAGNLHVKAVLVGIELVVIYQIIRIVRRGRRRHWHERWLHYRALAESLRHGRFLAFVSEFGRIHDTAPGQRELPWTVWYLRATMREIGLPNALLDAAYQKPLLEATLTHEVDAQLVYHRGNAAAMHEVDHLLHSRGTFCFVLTFVILAIFGAIYLAYLATLIPGVAAWLVQSLPSIDISHALHSALYASKPVIVLFAAGLPALGAAYAGIRVQGDFPSAMERSERMAGELAELRHGYLAAIGSDRQQLDHTAEMLIETARIMSEDLAAWQELYGRKRLNLPA